MALYNDLDLPPLELEEVESLRTRVSELESTLKATEEDRQTLRHRTASSEETISILERNMSSLFSTARLEIKRKDDELLRLRALLARERAIAYAKEEMLRNWLIELTSAGEKVQSIVSDLSAHDMDEGRRGFVQGHLEKWWELARLPALAAAAAAGAAGSSSPAMNNTSGSESASSSSLSPTIESSQQYRQQHQHQQQQQQQQRQQSYPQQQQQQHRGGGPPQHDRQRSHNQQHHHHLHHQHQQDRSRSPPEYSRR